MPSPPPFTKKGQTWRKQRNAKRPNRRKYMTKTTKKGAYNKTKKNAMAIRRAPFVETKSKTSEDLVDQGLIPTAPTQFYQSNTPHKHINPEVFFCWKQGLGEAEVIGKSLYTKYLKRKLIVRFPQPPFQTSGIDKEIPIYPQHLELIWGFVPMPLNLTGNTTPTVYNNTVDHINAHINQRVVDYFQDRADYLRFVPKKASTIRIIGRRSVKPNLNQLTGMAPQLDSKDDILGTVPDFTTSIYWPMNRKLHLEKANDMTGTGVEGYFPNYTWLPFCILYDRDWDDLPTDKRVAYAPSVAYNDAIYYTDS
jgi:hypothetical protein